MEGHPVGHRSQGYARERACAHRKPEGNVWQTPGNVISEVTHEFIGSLSSLFSSARPCNSRATTRTDSVMFPRISRQSQPAFPPNLPAMSRVMFFQPGLVLRLRPLSQADGQKLNFLDVAGARLSFYHLLLPDF